MDENVEWRKITCYNVKDNYQINEYGVIYNEKTKRFLKGRIDQHGYYQVKLSTKTGKIKSFLTHRLVAMTFLEYDENNVYNGRYGVGMTVDHIDGNILNNKASNLEWVSQAENNRRKPRDKGVHKAYSKYGKFKYILLDSKYQFKTIRSLAKFLGVSETQAHRYIDGECNLKRKIELIY